MYRLLHSAAEVVPTDESFCPGFIIGAIINPRRR